MHPEQSKWGTKLCNNGCFQPVNAIERGVCDLCIQKEELGKTPEGLLVLYEIEHKQLYPKRYQTLIKHGMKWRDYAQMHKQQEGKCPICGKELVLTGRDINIDHNHITMFVRGLLCSACNSGLGMFRDNQVSLNKAKEYLNKSPTTFKYNRKAK